MKTSRLLVESAGWLGACLILSAYFANVSLVLNSDSTIYLCLNVLGAGLLAWNVFVKKSWPAFSLEIVWLLIVLFGIVKISLLQTTRFYKL